MEPTGLPQCVWEESTLLWEPFMFCFQEKRSGKGELLLLSTRFSKQKTKAMQRRLQPPSPRQKHNPGEHQQLNLWQLLMEAPGTHGG